MIRNLKVRGYTIEANYLAAGTVPTCSRVIRVISNIGMSFRQTASHTLEAIAVSARSVGSGMTLPAGAPPRFTQT